MAGGEKPSQAKGAEQPDDDPGSGEQQRVPDDETQDVAPGRAERDPHAEFVRALGDAVRNHRVDADGGEDEGDGAEDRHHHPDVRQTDGGVRDHLLHRAHAENRLLRVDGGELLPNDRYDGGRLAGSHAGDDHHRQRRRLLERNVERRAALVVEPVMQHVAHDADDGDPGLG